MHSMLKSIGGPQRETFCSTRGLTSAEPSAPRLRAPRLIAERSAASNHMETSQTFEPSSSGEKVGSGWKAAGIGILSLIAYLAYLVACSSYVQVLS
jgi:hypothetical protein